MSIYVTIIILCKKKGFDQRKGCFLSKAIIISKSSKNVEILAHAQYDITYVCIKDQVILSCSVGLRIADNVENINIGEIKEQMFIC